jgi:murein DD-endopeptidase MepM/ murein hydrolase activator NlpD
LQKPTDGVRRPVDTARRRAHRAGPIARLNAWTIGLAYRTRARLHQRAGGPVGGFATSARSSLRPLATTERILPIGVAGVVAIASLLAVLPTTAGAVGGTSGAGEGVRITIGGVNARTTDADVDAFDALNRDAAYRDGPTFTPVVLPDVTTEPEAESASLAAGNVLDDGTLLTGYAPATDVADGSDLVRKYRVRSGDTLVTIADSHDVSMMTLWWANKLKSKDDLHVGQVLRIPPVSGLVVTVTESDTLDAIATKYDVKPEKVIELNGLEDPTLVVGQVLILPGAKGEPIPTPKPTPKPDKARSGGNGGGGNGGGGNGGGGRGNGGGGGQPTYTGGRFHWPVVGGGNYVSQYAHSGHVALDIAGDYGSSIVAASGGRVVFAGWKSNGGGWQVWISHGNGVYTTYNHMSGVSVGNGQSVGRGTRVGRLGSSGWATGPHLHFEVWRGGQPWSGGYQVNPMRYF